MVRAVPRPQGALRDRHGRWARDAMAALDRRTSERERTAKSRGPGLPTLRSSWRVTSPPATGAIKPGTPGRARISRNTIVQGRPRIAPVEPVVSNSCAFYTAHEAAGATSARPSLRSVFRGTTHLTKTRAKRAARSRTHVCISCRREPTRPTPTPPPAPARSRSPSRRGCGHAFWLDRARGRSDRSCPPGTRRTGTRRRRSTR